MRWLFWDLLPDARDSSVHCTSIWMRSHMNEIPYECDPIWMWSHMNEQTTLQRHFGVSFVHSYGITFIWDLIYMGSHTYRRAAYRIWSVVCSFIWDHIRMGSHSYGITFIWDLIHMDVQAIAFGVSFPCIIRKPITPHVIGCTAKWIEIWAFHWMSLHRSVRNRLHSQVCLIGCTVIGCTAKCIW